MKHKHLLISLFTLFWVTILDYQGICQTSGAIIEGIVLDANGEGLPGVNIIVIHQETEQESGTITDINGKFKVPVKNTGLHAVNISYVGFEKVSQTVKVDPSEDINLGSIRLESESIGLEEVKVIASVAVDRETPVAVSTIKRRYIMEKASNQEFPELLKTTPGVYATKTGGGYGDSRINVRGFNDENVAVLINGIPVNDMENGNVYWSNWAGLTDVTSVMQVQRGLGASKVAVPSIGGTINILTKTTDAKKGGYIFYGIGNDNYRKTGFSLSSGLTEKNWAVSVAAAKIEGDGWADGLQFDAYNYFINVSKKLNDRHMLSFTGFGAPQRHGQRQNMQTIETFRNAPQGIKYNADWGYLNGQVVNVEDNFYHKPQFSLNHYWTINETSELSTALYASIGTGGGGGFGTDGSINFGDYRTGNEYSPYDLDAITEINLAADDGHAIGYLRASRNDHRWYGALSTYTKELNSKIDLLAGLDLRYYKGIHFSEVTDLLGADYVLDDFDVNNPVRRLQVGDKREYYNDGIVLWEGGFLQLEYSEGPLAAFVSLAGSNTSYKRIDYYNYLDSDPQQETDFQNFLGFQLKGGANYNITRNHNIFANLGYFEKAPDFDAVFQNFRNDINEDAENQKILSYEIGYGFRSTNFSGNLNVYRTTWKDRTFTDSFNPENDDPNTPIDETTELYFANILGVGALHQGVEFDFTYNPLQGLSIYGMASFGDWTWQDNVDGVTIFDEGQNEIGTISTLYIKDLKVGDAAQTTAALGLDYNFLENLKVGFTYNYYSNIYADYDPTDRDGEDLLGVQAFEIPDYGLFDINASFDFKIGQLGATLYGNINNLFDEEYISDAQDGTVSTARVFYGIGRTWTTGLRINF